MKAKIIATLGPTSQTKETIKEMVKAGMSVARLNFSHGSHEHHARQIELIREITVEIGEAIGILQDLQGPKIRVGALPEPLALIPGETIILFDEGIIPPDGSQTKIPVDFPGLFDDIAAGNQILLDDGRLALMVETVSPDENYLIARVINGGKLSSDKGINVPGVRFSISGFTEKDQEDLAFGISHDVDAVAISFVRSAADVMLVRDAIRQLLKEDQRRPWLIAKLERPEALNDLDAILSLVDGVMVARGDLGVELPPEQVPVWQKRIIRAANERAKLVITATQMLESMVSSRLPTRAEASDVANAIFDGTDLVMLSAETAVGSYPVETIKIMKRIVEEAESHLETWGMEQGLIALGDSDPASMARAAHELAHDRDVSAVAVFTMQGKTAWLMSKVRPRSPILAFTPDRVTFQRLAFLRGVNPRLVPFANTMEDMLERVDAAMLKDGVIQVGQQVVLVCGFPVGTLRPPNMALLHTVGE